MLCGLGGNGVGFNIGNELSTAMCEKPSTTFESMSDTLVIGNENTHFTLMRFRRLVQAWCSNNKFDSHSSKVDMKWRIPPETTTTLFTNMLRSNAKDK